MLSFFFGTCFGVGLVLGGPSLLKLFYTTSIGAKVRDFIAGLRGK